MQTILIPYDASEPSQRALRYVLSHAAGPLRAKVHLLNVQAPPFSYTECLTAHPVLSDDEKRLADGRDILRPATKRLIEAGFWCEAHVVLGTLEQMIINHVFRLRCDAIVMGSHLTSALGERRRPTTASGAVLLAGIPVTLID